MKKIIALLLLCVVLCTGCAGKLIGTWQAEGTENTMELRSGGVGIMAGSLGEYEVKYRVKGDKLLFTDDAGAEGVLTYELDGDVLTTYDYNGNPTVYNKVK